MINNVNEVIRAVLKSLFFSIYFFFCYKRILHAAKAPKAPKAQRRNQAKAKNATSKSHLKTSKGGKSHLFAHLRFCAFFAREEKRIEKRETSPQC